MSNLMRYDPFEEIRALQKQFFGDEFGLSKRQTMATTDVYTEDDKQLIVEAHLPNFEEKDIEVNVDRGYLTIRAEKHQKDQDKNKKYVMRESSSSFYRRVLLPEQANDDKISADIVEGVLKVTVPFKELPNPKKISISSSSTKK